MNLRRSRAAGLLCVALPLALASPVAALAADSTSPAASDSTFRVSGRQTLNLSGREWAQSGGKGSGDFPLRIFASGTATVKGGSVHGDYPSTWTWEQLKVRWHYNGAGFSVWGWGQAPAGTLTLDGQHSKNIAVDAYRIWNAPAKLVIKNNRAEDIRDDFVSYPNESGPPNELDIENNLVETYRFLSWRHTSSTDTTDGKVRLVVRGNVVHLKPQAGVGTCDQVKGDGKTAGTVFKFDRYQGDPRLVTVENNVFLIEEGSRDDCTHSWLKGRYANNTIVYTGPSNLLRRYLGDVPAGVKVTTDRSVWDRAVGQWTARH